MDVGSVCRELQSIALRLFRFAVMLLASAQPAQVRQSNGRIGGEAGRIEYRQRAGIKKWAFS